MGNGGLPLSGREGLPVQLTRFFGREGETAELVRLVGSERVVSLVGGPGCGKTRLAIEGAAQVASAFAGGVWFVELAPIVEPGSVAAAVGAALGVPEQPGRPMPDVLVEALAGAEPVLLVVDNCEHVVDVAAEVVRLLVTECPQARVLATSRAALRVPGERVWQVPRLALDAAVELFVDRAGSVSGGSGYDRAEWAVIGEVCSRVDCLPLAVELAAAWSRVLSPSQILERLTRVLPELAPLGGGRGSRHDTMAAAVDWSYRLLPPDAQGLFQKVAVFAGSFDLVALEAVAGPEDDVLGWLTVLVDNSLVLTERPSGGPMRYRMVEPVRQHAAALLAGSGDEDEVRRRHVEYYLDLAARYDPWELWVTGPPVGLERLTQEEPNLLAAFEWARSQPSELGLRAAVALTLYWAYGGRVNDGRRWLDEVLAASPHDRRLHAGALAGAGMLAWRHGDYDHACSQLEEAVALAASLDDPLFYARVLLRLAPVEFAEGRLDDAMQHCHDAIGVYQACAAELGSPSAPIALGIAIATLILGSTSYIDGNVSAGDEQMHAALEANKPFGNPSLAAYGHLGLVYGAIHAGDVESQRTHLAAAAAAMDQGGIVEQSDWLWLAGCMAAGQGRYHTALRLIGAGNASSQLRGSRPPTSSRVITGHIERSNRAVSPALVEGILTQGQRMRWDELVAEALTETQAGSSPLTRREHEIAELVAEGLTNVDIAQRLVISRRTVESHIDHIRQKLGLGSRNEIIIWVLRDSAQPRDP